MQNSLRFGILVPTRHGLRRRVILTVMDLCISIPAPMMSFDSRLVWVDNCREQLGQLRHFLLTSRISTGEVLRRGDGVFTLQVASPQNVLGASKQLLPYCFKKKFELRLTINYYENRITGTETIEGFNSSVRMGVRVGKIRISRVLPKYGEGKREIAARRGRRSQLLRRLR